jgi:PPOX class probable F420-dependent enzyme
MDFTDAQVAFLEHQHSAAMVTLQPDGTPHVARVGVALVDGRVWSSATQDRVRTANLRRDPRSTLFVFDGAWRWLALEGTVEILDGSDAPELSLRLFEEMQRELEPRPGPGKILWSGGERTFDEFLRIMVEERRLIYQLEVERAYGLH